MKGHPLSNNVKVTSINYDGEYREEIKAELSIATKTESSCIPTDTQKELLVWEVLKEFDRMAIKRIYEELAEDKYFLSTVAKKGKPLTIIHPEDFNELRKKEQD